MTGLWEVVIPEATTNRIPNPSFETATTGWTAYSDGSPTGTSGARDTTWASRGRASYKFVKTGGSGGYGVQYASLSVSDLAAGTTVTFSLDVYTASSGTNLLGLFIIDDHASASDSTAISGPCNGRYSVSIALAAGPTTVTVGITFNTSATGTVYVDGAQLEAKTYDTTYCDGDQAGCEWTGTSHASTSTRSAQSRAGGKLVNLDDYGFYVTELQGVGMPPLRHQADAQALIPGALFRGTRVQPRTFVIHGQSISTTRGGLHDRRQDVINALKPDRAGEEQPVLLRYTLDGVTVQIKAVYDAGLDFGTLAGHTEEIALRLVAYDPFWYSDTGSVKTLSTTASVADADYILSRINGLWTAIGANTDNIVYQMALSPTGAIYVAGGFTTIGGTAADGLAKYENGAWGEVGGGVDGIVYALAIAPNGDVYVGGDFHTVNGGATTVNHIARWDVSASGWAALGTTGVNDVVYGIAIANDGKVYAVGKFTTAEGTTVNYVAEYNPGTDAWSAMQEGATPGLNGGYGYDVAIAPTGDVYVVGDFIATGSVSAYRIVRWDGNSWHLVANNAAPDSGANDVINKIVIAPDGSLFIAGEFTEVDKVACAYIAQYNGSQWLALESGLNGEAQHIAYNPSDNILYVSGAFTATGAGLALTDRLAMWNRYTWAHLDLDLPGATTAYCFAIKGDDLLLGFGTDGTATASAATTVTNSGTRSAYPKVIISRSGGTSAVVKYLRNETQDSTIWLNYSLLDGETLTLDFTPGARTVTSSFFGAVWRAVLPGSDLGKFALLPGDNTILTYVEEAGSPTLDAYMEWHTVHWSIDGVGV